MPRVQYVSIVRVLVVLGLCCIFIQINLSASIDKLDRDGVNPTEGRVDPKIISDIRRSIEQYNAAQTIYNEDIYGPVQNDTVIIAIQVHTRLTYLRHLIVSLAQAKHIERTLLIFSHDYYDEEINSVVRSIDFAKVMQIFYPYSIQTYPNEFPGVDPNDCPRDVNTKQAIKMKCNNALHPDVYGHYREAKYTQTKHHWWWKANRIFNQLESTATHTGMVVFLEEDHYVAEDLLHMLELLRSTADKTCPQCQILCLGTYQKNYQFNSNSDQMEIMPYKHNMGIVFNSTVWKTIMKSQNQFCTYDDYNWDYSLLHLSKNKPDHSEFIVMLCKGPRVFHIGECGIHYKKSNCNPVQVVSEVQMMLQQAKRFMFPSRLVSTVDDGGAKGKKKLMKETWDIRFMFPFRLGSREKRKKKLVKQNEGWGSLVRYMFPSRLVFTAEGAKQKKKQVKQNGGWGDIRDRQLCTNMTKISRQAKKYFHETKTLTAKRE